MAATLNYFSEMVKKSPADFKDLANSFVVILRQIVEHRLPREYDYHRMPAPWIQMKILEILSYLGADDKSASETMYDIISQVLKRADDAGSNIGYALAVHEDYYHDFPLLIPHGCCNDNNITIPLL